MSKRIEKIKKVINEIKIESDANFMYLKKALYRWLVDEVDVRWKRHLELNRLARAQYLKIRS